MKVFKFGGASVRSAEAVRNLALILDKYKGESLGMVVSAMGKTTNAMEELDIPPIPEFVEMISDSGAGLYACKASVDMFKLSMDDFIEQVDDIITVGEFYEMAGGGQIIFT